MPRSASRRRWRWPGRCRGATRRWPAPEPSTWVPIWTPFAVLARLGLGIPTIELLGAGAVLTVFIALEVIFLGRLFRASLLGAGKPAWKQIFAMVRSPDAGRNSSRRPR